MIDLDPAAKTQLANIEKRTGKSVAALLAVVKNSGLSKHGEIVAMLKSSLGMGHGDANLIAHVARTAGEPSAAANADRSISEVIDGLYSGPKEALRPIHDKLMQALDAFGDFEVAPKKTYVSYRRKKQFAMIGPATNSRVEVGLNMKGVDPTQRLVAQPSGKMCNYLVKLTDVDQVNAELISWVKTAYDNAG